MITASIPRHCDLKDCSQDFLPEAEGARLLLCSKTSSDLGSAGDAMTRQASSKKMNAEEV